MGLINWIFDFYQQHQIGKLREDAARARGESAAVRGIGGSIDPPRLERALGELALAVKTLQRVMLDKGLCTPEELEAVLRKVDSEDGRQDGRTPLP